MGADPFALLGSRRVARLTFLTVDREYRMGEKGWMARDVVRHPGSVVIVPWDGERILFIRQYRTPVARAVLELPAGKLDVPGEPPEATAMREAVEEIGRRPGALSLLHTVLASPGFTDERSWIYLAEDLEVVSASPQGVEEESAQVIGLTLAEVATALADGTLEDATTLIGVYAALDRLSR